MSEINNKEVNEEETKEVNEDNDKEKTSLEKFNSLSPADQDKIREECANFEKEHPDATREEKHSFASETISNKYDEANDARPPREKSDDLER